MKKLLLSIIIPLIAIHGLIGYLHAGSDNVLLANGGWKKYIFDVSSVGCCFSSVFTSRNAFTLQCIVTKKPRWFPVVHLGCAQFDGTILPAFSIISAALCWIRPPNPQSKQGIC